MTSRRSVTISDSQNKVKYNVILMILSTTIFLFCLSILAVFFVVLVIGWKFRTELSACINAHFTAFPMKKNISPLRENICRKNSMASEATDIEVATVRELSVLRTNQK